MTDVHPKYQLSETQRSDAERIIERLRCGEVPVGIADVRVMMQILLDTCGSAAAVGRERGKEIDRLNQRLAETKADCEKAVMDLEYVRNLQAQTDRINTELRADLDTAVSEREDAKRLILHMKGNIESLRNKLRATRPALQALQHIADAAVRSTITANEDG
jgi:chromosome segregation ATPase